ncbi:MAG: DUF697 domain-containing protein [Saprospiraceae bacterium]|nr:DUF697 domain-containing protein [Saprospiraceae bacterium]
MDNQKELAHDIVKSHVMYSLGAGLVPVPLLDIAAVSAVQLDMLRQLAKLYGKSFKESSGKSWISVITGSTLARMGASLVKTIPGIGSILGGVTMSALSGASTYAIGQVFIWHFSTGGDFMDFNFDKAKEIYEKEFEKGKKVAKDLAKEKEQAEAEEVLDDNPYDKLEKLAALKDKGIISQQDFEEQKKRILDAI